MSDLGLITEVFDKAGWWGASAAATVVGIRQLRHPSVQQILPDWARWSELPPWGRTGLVAVSSLLSALVAGLLSGTSPGAAVLASAPATIAAVIGHKVSKGAGHVLQEMASDPFLADMGYEPGRARKVLDRAGLLPLDWERLKVRPGTSRGPRR